MGLISKKFLFMMANMFGIVASNAKRKAPLFTEGRDNHPIFKSGFSGHHFRRAYPDMNKKNTDRKAKHRAHVTELAEQGICWTPFGLYRMNH